MILDILVILVVAGLAIQVYKQQGKLEAKSREIYEYTDTLVSQVEKQIPALRVDIRWCKGVTAFLHEEYERERNKSKAGRIRKGANKATSGTGKTNGRKK